MKNVIVFALGGARYAIELRWVREVIALGHITPLPMGPAVVSGVVNFHGAIVPVLELAELIPEAPPETRPARVGDGAVLIEVEGTRAALRIDIVHSVSTLAPAGGGALLDPRGRAVPLLEPPALLAAALAATQARGAELAAELAARETGR